MFVKLRTAEATQGTGRMDDKGSNIPAGLGWIGAIIVALDYFDRPMWPIGCALLAGAALIHWATKCPSSLRDDQNS